MSRKLLFLFLDGVGLGSPDPDVNPFARRRFENIEMLSGTPWLEGTAAVGGKGTFRALDARLDIPGLPQSATGQATLLTGVNAAHLMTGHYGPWPGPTIKRLLVRSSLFSEAAERGRGAYLANAYPAGYLSSLGTRRNRGNVPVHAALAAGLELPDLDSYARGRAIAADLTGEYFATLRPDVPVRDPWQAGADLAGIASDYSFTFFDYWLSDQVGHGGDMEEAVGLLDRLDRFIGGAASALTDTTLLITSDHGNLEDLSVGGHTLARVPLLVIGPGHELFADCTSLLDVAPTARRLLGF